MTSAESITLIERKSRPASSPEAGLLRQVLAYTENLMLVRHEMKKGWVGALHSHPHEQLVYVVSGHIRFTSVGKIFDARTGDSFVVPGGAEHQACALEASEVLDVFTPFCDDYATQ